MAQRRWLAVSVVLGGISLLGPGRLLAQASAGPAQASAKLEAKREAMKRWQAHFDRMPAKYRERLSAGAQNLRSMSAHFAERSERIQKRRAQSRDGGVHAFSGRSGALSTIPLLSSLPPPTVTYLSAGRVSQVTSDVWWSGLEGFTQSETSTAWCAPNAVVGYNDSGSYFETLAYTTGGISFNGVSQSKSNGSSYADLGPLNPGADPALTLLGNPVLACTSPTTFYYASLLEDISGFSDVSVSKSTDTGLTWQDPVVAATKDDLTHILDKEWMAVDPTDPNKIYVTYTDFDSSGSICGTVSGVPLGNRTGIELVRSTDGGNTWTTPGSEIQVTDGSESCDNLGVGNHGSQVVVNSLGHVLVSYLHYTPTGTGEEIDFKKSTDGGATFSPVVIAVASLTPTGSQSGFTQVLQGGFRTNDFPSMAVDRSGLARNGYIYIAWNDARAQTVPDIESDGNGLYGFADVYVTRSTDGGATFARVPERINNSLEPLVAFGSWTDQFMPAIAVDKTGIVAACFYDRRRDAGNFLIDRECAKSSDGGGKWLNAKKTTASWSSSRAQDLALVLNPGSDFDTLYYGDYDTLTGDWMKLAPGFRGAYADGTLGNPDVKSNVP